MTSVPVPDQPLPDIADGLRLIAAFSTIEDRAIRQAIVRVVEDMATEAALQKSRLLQGVGASDKTNTSALQKSRA